MRPLPKLSRRLRVAPRRLARVDAGRFIVAVVALLSVFCSTFAYGSESRVVREATSAERHTEPRTKRNVLLLNSYHQTTPWVLKVTHAVVERFRGTEAEFELHVENMDTKRIRYDQAFDSVLLEYYRHKFAQTKFAVIIASDNNAFEFLRAHHDELFAAVPVVFCGVNDFRPEMLAGHPLFTGVAEVLDVDATLRVAVRLMPHAKRVFVVNDQTETGLAVTRLMSQSLAPYRSRIEIEFAPEQSMVELESRLAKLPPDSFVLLGTYLRDRLGRHYPPNEVEERIARSATGPVFGVVDIFFENHGTTGGNLVSGYNQGEVAATMALRILREGIAPSAISVITKSQNPFLFDYRALERWKLPIEALPPGSVVLNRPASFYEQYRTLVWAAAGTAVALLAIIATLLGHVLYRRRSEQLLRRSAQDTRTIFNHAFDAFVIQDYEGHIVDVNERTGAVLGTLRESALGRTLSDFASGTEQGRLIEDACRRSLSEQYVTLEWEAKRQDSGVAFPAQVILRRIDLGGKAVVQASIRDITERKQLDEELAKHREHLEELVKERTRELALARDRAEVAARAKSTFLAHMSHEIRTPLNAILGFSRLLQENEGFTPEQGRQLSTITRAGEHLLTLTNGVLDMSRIEAGRVALERKPLHLPNLLDDLMMLFGARVGNGLVSLSLDRDPKLPQWVLGDLTKLRQVLVNLVGNAIKFTKTGSIVLRVRGGAEESRARTITFEVEDTGVGIAESDLSRVFRPFEQATGQPASILGTGLGLSISQHFVRLMGGELSVRSKLHEGSVFSFTLHLDEAESSGSEVAPESVKIVRCLAPNQQPWRVLAIDDNEDNLDLLLTSLRAVGFEATGASSGREGLVLFQRLRPHAVFMDVMMPEMDGLEATRRLRELPTGRTTPIFVLTASVFEEERHAVLATGADEFLRKPFQSEVVFALLQRHLGVKYLYRELPAPASERGSVAEVTEGLSALPEELKREIRTAAEAADQDQVLGLCERVEAIDPQTAARIRRMVADFQYERLLVAL